MERTPQLLCQCCACMVKMMIRIGWAISHPQNQAPVSGVMLLLHVLDRELLRYFGSCLVPVYHISDSVHAGLELLQPAIARQAEQCLFSFEDGSQLLFLAAAAAACLAEASMALHVSLSVCWPSSAGCLSACSIYCSCMSPRNCKCNRHAVIGLLFLQSCVGSFGRTFTCLVVHELVSCCIPSWRHAVPHVLHANQVVTSVTAVYAFGHSWWLSMPCDQSDHSPYTRYHTSAAWYNKLAATICLYICRLHLAMGTSCQSSIASCRSLQICLSS